MTSHLETLQAGVDAHRAGRLAEAEYMYRRVLANDPRNAGAIHLLGLLAVQMDKLDLAAQLLGDAARIDTFSAIYPADLGEVYRQMGRLPEAVAAYRQSVKLDPKSAQAQTNLATLLAAQGELDEAAACCRKAIAVDSNYALAHRHLGTTLEALGHLAEAQQSLETCVRLTPGDAQSYFDLGHCLQAEGKLFEALACFQKAIQLQPDFAAAHYHCGTARLAGGNFASGWGEFEWGLQPLWAENRFTQPAWNGAPLEGRTILLHAHCPLGDTLQFLRYVPLVRERGGDVILEVAPGLVPLVEQSGFSQVTSPGDGPPAAATAQASLLSLPRIFGTTFDTIPARVPYLAARDALVEQWRQRLGQIQGFKVGIVWQGDPAADGDRFRSIPLAAFRPLAQVPGVRLISLQKHDGLQQITELGGQFPLVDFGDEFDGPQMAFMDTAAIMKSLDLVITCDTATAHLAGGLGVPVWIALSFAADWRWFEKREDSPWYSSARLFRQSVLGRWEDVFERIAAALTDRTSKKVLPRT